MAGPYWEKQTTEPDQWFWCCMKEILAFLLYFPACVHLFEQAKDRSGETVAAREHVSMANNKLRGKTTNWGGRTMKLWRKDQSVFEVRISVLLTILMWISFKLWLCAAVWKDFVTRGFRWIWLKPATKPRRPCQTTLRCALRWKAAGSRHNLFSWKLIWN